MQEEIKQLYHELETLRDATARHYRELDNLWEVIAIVIAALASLKKKSNQKGDAHTFQKTLEQLLRVPGSDQTDVNLYPKPS